MSEKKQQKLLKILLVFIILQPVFDVLSRGAILEYIPKISTFIKPLFVFGLAGYLLLFHSPQKKKWLIYAFLYLFLTIGHTYLLYRLLVDTSVIIHELRFLLNIAYMIALYISFDTLCYYSTNKEEMYRSIKRAILYSFILYFVLFLLAVITKTSGMTYEIADKNKLGFKGWYHSGQILGHAYSIMLPIIMYITLDPKKSMLKRGSILLLFIISVSLIGTKVPYYMTLIVLILYLFITIFIKLFNKEHKPNLFNIIFSILMLIGMLYTYKYTPVKFNTDLNNKTANTEISKYDLEKESCYEIVDEEILRAMHPGKDIHNLLEYNIWSNQASSYLSDLFKTGQVHPSNMRVKQYKYISYKYSLANIWYKIFGLGFLNQNTSLAIETDFNMAYFSFGILGFVLFLLIPIKEFIFATVYIIKNFKTIDFETYMLYMGLGIFFCISMFVGATYIYTNCSIFLILLITMLKIKRDVLRKSIIKDNKISFLLLHLGYGGIETATVNTANTLCNEYEVELVSFYNLSKNQANRVDKRINIKYLYNGEPNRDIFIKALKEHKVFKVLKEGIKAVNILIKKKVLLINEIRNCNAKYIISTRYDFSTLLSKYGYLSNVKIAQEHHYHNNNKKYINILTKTYYNIDYLCALTETLYNDYHTFLKHNYHTKIVLMPNMLYDIPTKKSKLTSKNIITMSRFDYGKKNEDIIKAFAKVKNKDWKLYLLGDGNLYQDCCNLVKELKLEDRVFLPGYVAKENIEKYLLDSSIFVMASLTEGLPMVLLEAMSYGIPCIAYETASGVNDIIADGYNGYVIKDRNEEAYVKALEKLMNNQKLLQTMGKNASASIERFSRVNILKKWNKLLKGEEDAKKKKKN